MAAPHRSSSRSGCAAVVLLLPLALTLLLRLRGAAAVSFDAVPGTYMTDDGYKAFKDGDVEWRVVRDNETGKAFFWTKGDDGGDHVQWHDPRPPLARAWADAKSILLLCCVAPPVVLALAMAARLKYIQEYMPGLLNPSKERKVKKAHWPRSKMKPPGSFRKSSRPTK